MLEEAIVADFGLVRAWKGDRHGNLVFRDSRAQLQPAGRDGRPGHDRRGRGAGRARRARPRTTCTRPGVFVQRVVRADAGAGRRQADREADRARARRRPDDGAGPVSRWPRAPPRELDRRVVRQPRHRAADAGAQLRARRRRARAAVRERHPRRRRLPVRGRGGPRPDQRRQGDRHAAPGRVVLRLRDVVRDDPRRQDRRRDPRRDAGLGQPATSPTG